MITFSKILMLLCLSSFSLAEESDLINFENDDTLHGKFIGFTSSGKIIWKHASAEKNIAFQPSDVRKVIMNKGQRTKPFTHTSYVTLKNLDTIPGNIVSLTENQLAIETDYSGEINISKDQILDINLNPLGDKVIYRGPYSKAEDWKLKYFKTRNNELEEKKGKEKTEDPWKLQNFSLKHKGVTSAIIKDIEFPAQYRLTFNSYSSQSYYPSVILIADQKVPAYDEENKEVQKNRNNYKSSPGNHLGSSIIIRLHPVNPNLTHYGFNADGSLFQNNITSLIRASSSRTSQNNFNYDIRVDKETGLIMLYANKNMIGHWQIESKEVFDGNTFGFYMQYSSAHAHSSISDISVTSWNGIKDSAMSLENETRDIVMLNNGTDRYSGNISKITSSTVDLKTEYAELEIPQTEISSIYLARGKSKENTHTRDTDDVTVHFYGTGRITGTLSKAQGDSVFLESDILGKIKVKSEYISSFEFTSMEYAYEKFK